MHLAPKANTPAENERVDHLLATLMDGYCATVDVPSNLLTPELLRTFPDAIVIATTRDAAGWLRSVKRMEAMVHPWYYHLVVFWIPVLGNFHWYMLALRRMFVWRFGHDKLEITDLALHEEHLRAIVPREKLFWVDCKEGWEPICRILGVPVPDIPFPHNNKPQDGEKVFRSLMALGLSLWVGVLATAYGVLWATGRYLGR